MEVDSSLVEPLTESQQQDIWSALAYSFSNLFGGNPAGFYHRHDDGKYEAVHREPSMFDFLAHISGSPDRSMLSVPLLPNGNCRWAAIDVDRKQESDPPIDWPELAQRITKLNLPLVAVCSKGGKGAWLFAFFKEDEGLPAADVRRILNHYAVLLALGTVEIFPKQVNLKTEEGLGSGINLPYRLIPRVFTSNTVAFGRDGEPLTVINDFIDLAENRRVWGALLLRRLPEAPNAAPAARADEPNETTVENAVAYLDRACVEFESMSDGRQTRATEVCYWLGRVIGGKPGDPRLEFQTVKDRITKALEKTTWDRTKFEVIERQLRVGMNTPIKLVEDDDVYIRDWPQPPEPEMFDGLVGEFTKLWQSHTEASPVALAGQFLTFYGHCIGRSAYYPVGGDDHHANLQMALVGPTAFARKGQSYSCVKCTFERVELSLGVPFREVNGLSSGEGLIFAVRDSRSELNKKGVTQLVDEGVTDKRLLVYESEFASVLKRMTRESNTLSEVMRQAWDSGNLGTLTRTAPLCASKAHISIITHVTPSDLQLYLSDVATMNGFANRFVFLATRRVQSLPDPGRPSDATLKHVAVKLAKAIEFGQGVGQMTRSAEASELWNSMYQMLSAPRTGRQHNAVLARGPAHVLRFSMIYALLDGSSIIESRHLRSAYALWTYAERTSRFVFGDSLGDKLAEKILELLKGKSEGMKTREITAKVGNKKHVPAALSLLFDNGQIRMEKIDNGRGGGQRWFVV